MCGIVGFVSKKFGELELNRALDEINHRGPDSGGVFFKSPVFLGHKRLAIHDLTPGGHQPMHSKSERFTVVFNGEIYNYKALIAEFNLICTSTSDTEVILHLIELLGFRATIEKLIGMFSIVVFDKIDNIIYLARDRMGEKPLFYYWDEENFIFCSELKSLYSLSDDLKIDKEALRSYFYYNYIPEKSCIVKNCHKLQPGEILIFDPINKKITNEIYWSIDSIYKNQKNSYKGSFDQALKDLDKLLCNVVEDHLASDVPIGAFLSGGVDSSLICAISQKVASRPINTFSIGFENKSYNEAIYAKDVASHLKTNHTELYVTANDCISLIDELAKIYDEPMSDSSQIPTVLLSKLTKQYVTVCLSGDAGDELFGGYTRYILGNRVNWFLENIPKNLRKISKEALVFSNNLSLKHFHPALYRKVDKLGHILESDKGFDFYENLITHWKSESPLLDKSIKPHRYDFGEGDSFIEKMMILDMKTYLPSDILVKVDRAAMNASLETRAPFLDQRIVEFALKLPMDYKVRNGNGKIILKELLYKYVPRELIDRPKMGFGVPLDSWLRNELKDWTKERFDKIKEDGILDFDLIQQKANEHFSGQKNWQYHLWDVLLFQSWKEQYKLKLE